MKIKYDCMPCIVKQNIKLSKMFTDDVAQQEKIIKRGLETLSDYVFIESPPYITAKLCEYAANVTGITDPLKDDKAAHNQMAEVLIEKLELRQLILSSNWPFEKAVRLSIAGNIIDFSIGYTIDESLVNQSIQNSLKAPIYGEALASLEAAIQSAKKILFLADNAGEIVFDKLLISLLPKKKVTYVVKGKPIVNDATMVDVRATEMDKIVPVVSTGSGIQGTHLKDCDDAFVKLFNEADLIISKGQANFETLNDRTDKNIFFLLRAKCQCIAEEIGCKVNDFVMIKPS